MKLKSLLLFLIIIQLSCQEKNNKQVETLNNRIQKIETEKENTNEFEFEKFKISKGKIGAIKVGMSISDAEQFLNSLTKTEAEAYDFGFDGGGIAYLYSLENEFVIALIPKRNSEEILAIIALSEKLETKNGLHPKATVAEIQQKYPGIKINQNLMMEWEFINDKKNNMEFVFMTSQNKQIGEYQELEIPVAPKRTDVKADWITIK